jgi:hypothetical protein
MSGKAPLNRSQSFVVIVSQTGKFFPRWRELRELFNEFTDGSFLLSLICHPFQG